MNELLPGDWYIENGLHVFTEQYLRRRGTCCGSGCRHCPYEPGGEEIGARTGLRPTSARRCKSA